MPIRRSLFAVAALALTASAASAQRVAPVTPDRPTRSDFGKDLSSREAGALLGEMNELLAQAIAASRAAEQAATVDEVKQQAARVVEYVWGLAPGVPNEATPEVARLGWKERWQVSGAEFDENFQERLGSLPPRITDARQLGIVGRGRAVRARLEMIADSTSKAAPAARKAAEGALAGLNDVIGWTHITGGYKGREVQPRISLTHLWNMPPAFWNSTADTGWLFEAEAQAINILKTGYAAEVNEAREHAKGLTTLLQRALEGVDANRNGTVEAIPMEAGLALALSQAEQAGLRTADTTRDR